LFISGLIIEIVLHLRKEQDQRIGPEDSMLYNSALNS